MNCPPSKPELNWLRYGRERPVLVKGCLYRPIGHESTLKTREEGEGRGRGASSVPLLPTLVSTNVGTTVARVPARATRARAHMSARRAHAPRVRVCVCASVYAVCVRVRERVYRPGAQRVRASMCACARVRVSILHQHQRVVFIHESIELPLLKQLP